MVADLEKKLAAARTRLILDRPFLGALVMRLPLVAADPQWCPTSATDARSIYYNEQYIADLSVSQVQFVLSHEALHCALSHFSRRGRRDHRRWDTACDLAINPILTMDKLEPPPGVLLDDNFGGMTAEEIYPCLDENDIKTPMDRHIYDHPEQQSIATDFGTTPMSNDGSTAASIDGNEKLEPREQASERALSSQPLPLSKNERELLAVHWQQRLVSASQLAMQAGKLSDTMTRIVGHLGRPQLPWRALLDRYLTATARDDYSYLRPSSRRGGDAVFPSLISVQTDLVIAVDTSGSIKDAEIDDFFAEISALKGQVGARITLLACGTELSDHGPWTFEPWETIAAPHELTGGGGTNFAPVFDWVADSGRRPDVLVYFTDGKGEFPEVEPEFPTVWLVKGGEPVPWGRRIQLN